MNKAVTSILFIILLLNCAVIFKFSSQEAVDSDKVSKSVTRKIVDLIPKLKNLNEPKKDELVKKLDSYIRKFAHFALYLALGFNAFLFIFQFGKNINKAALISFLLTVLYAISDEIHQLFVKGKSCELKDVLIDSAGSGIGIIAAIFIIKIITVFKKGLL